MAKTVMIVDDSRTLRHMVNIILKDAGYETVDAVDGLDALEKLSEHKVNLLICDINMPNMDGLTLLRELKKREEYSYIPVLMLTTESQAGKRDEAREAGATAWVIKPFTAEQMIKAVEKLAAKANE